MSKAQTVRERIEKIAHDYDVEGFGGALPKKSKAEPSVRKKSAYQEFVAKYRKDNKYSMSEISVMWKEHKDKLGNTGSKTSKKLPVKATRTKSQSGGAIKKKTSHSKK